VAAKTREGWRLEEPVAGDADAQTVERILGYVADLKGVTRWREDDPEISKLAREKIRIEVGLEDGRTHWVSLGELAGSGFRGYAKASSKKGIWEATKALWDAADRDTGEFRELRLITVDSFDADGFELTRGATVHRLEKRDENWFLRSPFEERADDYDFFDFLTEIEKVRAIEFVSESGPPEVLKRYGLDPPAAVVGVRGKGKTSTVSFGKVAGKGGADEWFARRHDRPFVARVKPEIARKVEIDDPQHFRGRKLLPPDLEIREITVRGAVEGRDVGFRARLEDIGQWRILEPHIRDVDLSGENLWGKFLAELNAMGAAEFVDEAPTPGDLEAKYGLGPSALRIEVVLRDSAPGARPAGGEPGRERTQKRTILLGRSVPEKGLCFAKLEEGKGNVVAVKDQVKAKELARGYVRFLRRELVDVREESVRWLEFEREGKVVRIERLEEGGTRWVIVKPAGGGVAEPTRMSAALGEDFRRAETYFQEAQNPADLPAEYGLHPPQAILRIAMDPPRRDDTRAREIELHYGAFRNNQSLYARYASAEGFENRNVVFQISRSAFDVFLELWKEKAGK
jgi:hypothetical protein